MRRQVRPFHARIGGGMFQPSRYRLTGHAPRQRLAGVRVELQALAGGTNQLGAVAVGQAAGDKRLGPPSACCLPAHLVRATPVLSAALQVGIGGALVFLAEMLIGSA